MRAKYVWFRCAEGYTTSIDMPTALHPQTQMTFGFDGKTPPKLRDATREKLTLQW